MKYVQVFSSELINLKRINLIDIYLIVSQYLTNK